MSNLQPNCCLEFDFRKVDQHAGGKWLIHDTKRRKDNQLQSKDVMNMEPSTDITIWIPLPAPPHPNKMSSHFHSNIRVG